jgi:hypothetical protein
MARNVQCQINLGPYRFTDVAPGPLALDYAALGLAPGQLPKVTHRIRARQVGMGMGVIPLGVNVIIVPDPVNPHTTATIQTVPAVEVQGTMDVDVYVSYGTDRAQETD